MIGKLFCPGLLNTGPIDATNLAVQDGPVNFYVVKAPAGLVCIDTGWRPPRLVRSFDTLGLNIRDVVAVLVTHLHWDHARCLQAFPKARILVGEHETPSFLMKRWMPKRPCEKVQNEQVLTVAGLTVQVIATPGHTPGSVSYSVAGRWLFTGDTLRLRCGEVFPFPAWFNQDGKTLNHSIQKLAQIKGIECLLTAHSGVSKDVNSAFAPWRGAADNLARGEHGL